jgi:hypothetical protein
MGLGDQVGAAERWDEGSDFQAPLVSSPKKEGGACGPVRLALRRGCHDLVWPWIYR